MSRFAEISVFLLFWQNCKAGLEWGWFWCWLWGIYIYHIELLTFLRSSSLCLFLARSSTLSALETFVSKYVEIIFLGFHLSSYFCCGTWCNELFFSLVAICNILLELFVYLCWCILKSIYSQNFSNLYNSCQVKILEWKWWLYVHGSLQSSFPVI